VTSLLTWLLEPHTVLSYWWSVDTKSLCRMVDEILRGNTKKLFDLSFLFPAIHLGVYLAPLLQHENLSRVIFFFQIDRTFLQFPSSEFLQIFKVPRGAWVLSKLWKLEILTRGFEKFGAKYGQKCNIQTSISPLNWGLIPPRQIFLRTPRAITCMGQISWMVP